MSSAADATAAETLADEEVGRDSLGGFLLALRTRGIRDSALLLAIERTPRREFLPPACASFAHQDVALPIACGQQATSPFVVAEALAQLDLAPHHSVLEIGTGTGWQTAVLARLARRVVTIERFQTLHQEAERRLRSLGSADALCLHGDGAAGHASGAPYDRVIVNAAVSALPPEVFRQLAPQAVVVAPLIRKDGQQLSRFTGADGSWTFLAPASFAELRSGRALAS